MLVDWLAGMEAGPYSEYEAFIITFFICFENSGGFGCCTMEVGLGRLQLLPLLSGSGMLAGRVGVERNLRHPAPALTR